jgi:hypothetical protein
MCKKGVFVSTVLLALMVFPQISSGTMVEEINITIITGSASYVSGGPDSELAWSYGGSWSIILTDGSTATFGSSDVSALLTDITDKSSGNIAEARFEDGILGFDLFDNSGTIPLIQLAGDILWYHEVQDGVGADRLTGKGIFKPDPLSITVADGDTLVSYGADPLQFAGKTIEWGMTSGNNGIFTETKNLNPIIPTDYQTSFSGNNLTLWFVRDTALIPEPATMLLLGLGSLGLIRRRR